MSFSLKNMSLFNKLCLLLLVTSIHGKIELVMDGSYEDCGTTYFDMTKLDFISYNDTHIFLNGKLNSVISRMLSAVP